jgi:hypothetical protein
MQPTKLKLPNLPRALGELSHSNQFLKLNILLAYSISLPALGFVFLLASRPPIILTLSPGAVPLEAVAPPKAEEEIERAARAYVELRYRWDQKNVGARLRDAEAFISPTSRKAYEVAAANITKFAVEKGVLERVYLNEKPKVDLEKRTIAVQGDRITAIQGLKAAADLRLELSFESGPRTREDPWGVYVTKEKEE